MKKICHVTSVHDVNDVRIFKKECISLAKEKDNKVYLVGPGIHDEEKKDVKIIKCGDRPISRIKRMLIYSRHVMNKALEVDADIYHLHDPELLMQALELKKRGKIVIFDSHENILDSIDEKEYLPKSLRMIIKKYYNNFQEKVLPKIDGIIVVSPQMIQSYRKYNSNVTIIGNFPIINNEQNAIGDFVYGRFLFAGGITEQWSHEMIIKAINNIDGASYCLYGSGEKKYIERLNSLSGWSKVHYGGKIPFEEVQTKIEEAEAVMAILQPGKNSFFDEGTLGNTKLFEAMANGRPVIASNFKLWRDIIEKNKCGICVNPNDEHDIENAMRFIMHCSNDKIKEMGQNGIDAVRKKYNWALEEKKLILFYNALMK